jgi:PIF1-like helicase
MSSKEHGTDRALQQISDFLQDGGHSLKNYGLPEPTFRSVEVLMELEAFEGRHEQLRAESNDMLSAMNAEQADIFHCVMDAVMDAQDGEIPSPFFIEGKPSQGKTFLVDALCSHLRSEGLIILIVGTSALAAALYERGRTAHSLFCIPVTEVSYMNSE